MNSTRVNVILGNVADKLLLYTVLKPCTTIFLFDDNTVFSFTLYANKDSNYDIESYLVEPYCSITKENAVTLGLYDAEKLQAEYAVYQKYREILKAKENRELEAAKKQEKLATKTKDRALLLERIKEELQDDNTFMQEITKLGV